MAVGLRDGAISGVVVIGSRRGEVKTKGERTRSK